MPGKVAGPCEALVALLALEHPYVEVRAHMVLHVAHLVRVEGAGFALKYLPHATRDPVARCLLRK